MLRECPCWKWQVSLQTRVRKVNSAVENMRIAIFIPEASGTRVACSQPRLVLLNIQFSKRTLATLNQQVLLHSCNQCLKHDNPPNSPTWRNTAKTGAAMKEQDAMNSDLICSAQTSERMHDFFGESQCLCARHLTNMTSSFAEYCIAVGC